MNYLILIRNLIIACTIFSCEGPEGPNGTDGQTSLVNIIDEPHGVNCESGGLKFETGLDIDSNNQLTEEEVITTKYVCNGESGASGLTNIVDEPKGNNCLDGGYKLQVGLDSNSNLILEEAEVQSTKYICGFEADKQVRLVIGGNGLNTRSTEWELSQYQTFHLIKFNKLDYANVDSITFVPSMSILLDPMFPAQTTTCHVELFNVTDNVPINNSQLHSNLDEYIFFETGNLYDDLPDREIVLGLRIKSDNPNLAVATGIRSYIFINKK